MRRIRAAIDDLQRWLAWRLPRGVIAWATIRLWAETTTGRYGSTEVPSLTVGEALDRWTLRTKGER